MIRSNFSRQERIALIILLAIGAALRLFPLLLSNDYLALQKLPDDAFYYFTIARNIAHGAGISFDGIHPTNGFHPLWQLLIVPIYSIGLDGWPAARAILALQCLIDLATLWLLASFLRDIFLPSKTRLTALLLCVGVYALNPYAAFHGTNGLETSLAALMLLGAARLLFMLQLAGPAQTQRWIAAGLAIGLAVLARTDCAIVLAPLCAYFLLQTGTRAAMAKALAMGVIVTLPWWIWNLVEFGSLLQSSASAVPLFAYRKYVIMYGGLPWSLLLRDAIGNALKPFAYLLYGISLVPVGLAFREGMRRRKEDRASQAYIQLLLLTMGGILLLLFHSLVRTFIREWYVEFLLPIFVLHFGVAVGLLLQREHSGWRKSIRYWLPAGALLLLGYMWSQSLGLRRFPSQPMLTREVPSYLASQIQSRGKLLIVGAFNSGIDGYFAPSGVRVINLDGVVNERAMHALGERRFVKYLHQEGIELIIDQMPDIIGYRNLFAPELFDDFPLDTTLSSANPPAIISVLRRRKQIVGQ